MQSLWRASDLTKQKKIENLKKPLPALIFQRINMRKTKTKAEKEGKGDDGKVKQTV